MGSLRHPAITYQPGILHDFRQPPRSINVNKMPVAVAGPLQAGITFSLPDSRLPPGTDVEVFEVTHTVQRPKETVVVPIIDLAPELKRLLGEQPSPLEQLETRGFSLLKHETSFDADDLNSQEGTDAYMAEQCE
jgi:hypothetical protein